VVVEVVLLEITESKRDVKNVMELDVFQSKSAAIVKA
jgi:hypothetical protein